MKHNFAKNFRKELSFQAKLLTSKLTNSLEKEMLEEHKLLVEATTLPVTGHVKKIINLAILIGTAQGMDNVHRAYNLSKELEKVNVNIKTTFITSGNAGISLNVIDKLKVPGINAYVMTEMLNQYGVPKAQVITEGWSKNADEQSQELSWITERYNFKDILLIVDTWHGPRFYMSMLKHNPNLNFFTEYVERDVDNIGSATYDFGQKNFQSALFIGEIARLHTYFERATGGVSSDTLIKYLMEKSKKKLLPKSLSSKKIERLRFLWNKNHKEIVRNFDKLSSYR
jgi:hypothetical protein